MKKLAFVEFTNVFAHQVKLPYATGCVWSYCEQDKNINKNYSFNVNDWYYILDRSFDITSTIRKLSECDINNY